MVSMAQPKAAPLIGSGTRGYYLFLMEDCNFNYSKNKQHSVRTYAERIERRKELPLLSLMAGLGGWPVLQGESWDSSTFDWVSLIGTAPPSANSNEPADQVRSRKSII